MTTLEKKQKLIEKVQAIPDHFVDDATTVLDAIIEKERLRKLRFEELLAETTEQYKAVFKALA